MTTQANYWWGQMHCGPPNQNFESPPCSAPMAALAVSLDSWFSGHRGDFAWMSTQDRHLQQTNVWQCMANPDRHWRQSFLPFCRSTVSQPWTTPGIARWPWRRWRIRSRQRRWIANKWLQLNG